MWFIDTQYLNNTLMMQKLQNIKRGTQNEPFRISKIPSEIHTN